MTTLYIDAGISDEKDMTNRTMTYVVLSEYQELLAEKQERGGTNNIAELLAVREAMIWAKANGEKSIQVFTDSRNNIAWANGRIKKSKDKDRALMIYGQIVALRENVRIDLQWVGRDQNLAGHYLQFGPTSYHYPTYK